MTLDRLKYWRQLRALSVRELAKEATVSPSTVTSIENGNTVPRPRVVRSLAEALGIDPMDLYSQADNVRRPDGVELAELLKGIDENEAEKARGIYISRSEVKSVLAEIIASARQRQQASA